MGSSRSTAGASGSKQQQWRQGLKKAGLVEARVWVPGSAKELIVDIGTRMANGEDAATVLLDAGRGLALPPVPLPFGIAARETAEGELARERDQPPCQLAAVPQGHREAASVVEGGAAFDVPDPQTIGGNSRSDPAAAVAVDGAGSDASAPPGRPMIREAPHRSFGARIAALVVIFGIGIVFGRFGLPGAGPELAVASSSAGVGAAPLPVAARGIEMEALDKRIAELTHENDQLAVHLEGLLGEISILAAALDDESRKAESNPSFVASPAPRLDVAKVSRTPDDGRRRVGKGARSTSASRKAASSPSPGNEALDPPMSSQLPPVPLPSSARLAGSAEARR
ncbi:MAG: hypothetical protein KAY22_08025 [Rhizorhabdus sp.]|uniref:hypothetical protein n=1 Tax=Rhizorhabdus sp. TaxID=1968843 RepID=UPI001B47B125|nr:hypothetical protein [Rhizorhabdus sp.]MBP8232235.1 hypothetical protein [Rhizorhabdus sp.]